MTLKEITEKLDALQTQAAEAVARVDQDASQYEEVKALIEGIKPEIDQLTAAREAAMRDEEIKALRAEHTTLEDAIKKLRFPDGTFVMGDDVESGKSDDTDPYADGSHSFWGDIRMANKGVPEARERLRQAVQEGKALGLLMNEEGKVMTEGTANQGGYLVRPLVERTLVETIESDNVLRALCSKINVNTNAIQLDQITLATTAGWVAELATKPETTSMSLATVTASVFTAAGLVTVSNQLLADSNPSVDQLVTADLAKRLTALEETAFLVGSGTGQPLGILNTPGINARTVTPTDISADAGLIDVILDAITALQTNHGAPTAILMHPRTWTRVLKDKDAQGAYILSPDMGVQGNRLGITRTLWGVPVVLSNRIPTNLGAGTNESRVIVGDFREALILDRQGITIDESPHVYFTTNQTVFRAEKRLGFTAARTPAAFEVIGGVGLAAG